MYFKTRNLLTLLVVFTCIGQVKANFQEALDAYQAKNYKEAITLFNEDWDSTRNISSLYNIGLANIALKNDLEAIYYFEKTLKYEPNNSDAILNASQLYSKINAGEYWKHPYSWFGRFLYKYNSKSWSFIALVFAILLSLGIFTFISTQKKQLRRLSQLTSVLSIILLTLSILASIKTANHISDIEYLYIKDAKITSFLSAGSNPTDVKLQANARYVVLKELDGYLQIINKGGDKLWVNKKKVLAY